MKVIGGYFEIELAKGLGCYHPDAIQLNTARCALEYILRAKKYHKIYIPYYTCDAIMEPVQKLGLKYEFYRIDKQLDPIFDKKINLDEAFLYTNYYGIKQKTVERIAVQLSNVIIDNSQAFFAPAIAVVDTFYSARKFFGVSDGAYLYTDTLLDESLEQDVSCERMSHLLKRFELGAEVGYADFGRNECSLINEPIKRMSVLTDTLLRNINYEKVLELRMKNFTFLHQALRKTNKLFIEEYNGAMVYPFWSDIERIRGKLIENKIFVAKYWENVENWAESGLEIDLMRNLIPLPIDQRYTVEDMHTILKVLNQK